MINENLRKPERYERLQVVGSLRLDSTIPHTPRLSGTSKSRRRFSIKISAQGYSYNQESAVAYLLICGTIVTPGRGYHNLHTYISRTFHPSKIPILWPSRSR